MDMDTQEDARESFTDLVRSAYQMQKTRIQMGNRLVASFRQKLGLDNDEPTSKQEKNVLREVKQRYKLVTEGIARKQVRKAKDKRFTYDSVISDHAEVSLCTTYFRLTDSERDLFEAVKRKVESYPIWDAFFQDVNGIGPKMTSVMISEFDPTKGKYVSSFWAYAGLDTVETWHRYEDGEYQKVEKPPSNATVDHESGRATLNGKQWRTKRIARSKRDQHREEEEYEAADGTTKTRETITYNPFLHDKLLGVAGPCMVRGRGHYKDVYDDYKHRIKNMDRHESKSDGHIHRMAIRYMVKMMVKDLYNEWRPLVRMPVYDPYSRAKLDKQPHGAGQ